MREQVSVELFAREAAGIYESLKTYEGVFFRLEEHLDRFFDSARTLGLRVPKTRPEIRSDLKKALSDSGKKDAFVRLTLVGDELFTIVSERTHPPDGQQFVRRQQVREPPKFRNCG